MCSLIAITIVSTLAIAPLPVSLHIRVLVSVARIWMLKSDSRYCNCFSVIGCSYICVFIAGATTTGFCNSQLYPFLAYGQHLKTFVIRLSQMPLLILAIVLALRGAITNIEAMLRNSIWRTGSPR